MCNFQTSVIRLLPALLVRLSFTFSSHAMSSFRAVAFCFALLSAAFLRIAESDDDLCKYNPQLVKFRSTFSSVAHSSCLNNATSVPAAICILKLASMLLEQKEIFDAFVLCEYRATALTAMIISNHLSDAKELATQKESARQSLPKNKRDGSAKLMDLQVMDFNMPLYGYINTVNVTNLEKFLKMQIDAKAQKDIDRLRKLQKREN